MANDVTIRTPEGVLAPPDDSKRFALPKMEMAYASLGNCLDGLNRLSEKFKTADLDGDLCLKCGRSGPTVESLAKTMSYTAKTVDETARLLEYAQGRADSRSEVIGLSDLLRLLTDEQAQQVRAWVGLERS